MGKGSLLTLGSESTATGAIQGQVQAQRSGSYIGETSGSEYRLMPTTRDNTGNWHEYRRLVLNELQRLSSAQDAAEAERSLAATAAARVDTTVNTLLDRIDEVVQEVNALKTGQAKADTRMSGLDEKTKAIDETVKEIKGKAAAISGTIGAAIAGLAALFKTLFGM